MTSSKPTHLPMAPPPDTIISGCRASAYELGGGHKLSVHHRHTLPGKFDSQI